MDTVAVIGRLLVSLAAVLGVMWLLARRMKKSGRVKDAGLIDVLGRQQLSRNSSVAVVRVGEQALVVGVTDTQVSVLGQTDLDAALAAVESGKSKPRTIPGASAGRRRAIAPARRTTPRATTASLTTPTPIPAPLPLPRRTDASRTPAVPDALPAPTAVPLAMDGAAQLSEPSPRSALAGSALSPQTWKQTLESLREMTAR